jgi:hypothetical protein
MAFSIRFTDASDTVAELRAAASSAGEDVVASVNEALRQASLPTAFAEVRQDIATQVESFRQSVSAGIDDFRRSLENPNAATVFDGTTLEDALARSGIPGSTAMSTSAT